jgi:hypothetical protein
MHVAQRLLIRIVLDLETQGDPIRGWISKVSQPARPFHGWLELAHELEDARGGFALIESLFDDKSPAAPRS